MTQDSKNGLFLQEFLEGLMNDCYKFRDKRVDYLLFGKLFIIGRIIDILESLAYRYGFVRRHFSVKEASGRLAFFLNHIDKLGEFYGLLQDEYSRNLLKEILKFKVIGHRHVKWPLDFREYKNKYIYVEKKLLKEKNTTKAMDWYLNKYELPGKSGTLSLDARTLNILNIFLLQQYSYAKNGNVVAAQAGDIVIDGGSGWGDSVLYFADLIGQQGRVYSFEFSIDNMEILEKNLKLNPRLAQGVKIVSKALWDKSKERLDYTSLGPASHLQENSHAQCPLQTTTISIDDFVEEERLSRLDYIKLDIEGSELRALQGAKKALCKFRPKLAISLYHKDEDLFSIPGYLSKLGLGYEFFLDHFTMSEIETVLFARSRKER